MHYMKQGSKLKQTLSTLADQQEQATKIRIWKGTHDQREDVRLPYGHSLPAGQFSAHILVRIEQKWRDRRGGNLPESQEEAHATLSLFPLLVLLCWPTQCRKDEGHFQAGLLFSGSGTELRLTLVRKNANILDAILHTSLLAGHSGWQDHPLLPSPLPQLFPPPVGMFWTWATACRLKKCGSCVHKPICVAVPHRVHVILDICRDQQKSCGKSRFTRLNTQVRIHFSDGSGYASQVLAWKNKLHAQPVYPEKVLPYEYHHISCNIIWYH